MSAHRNGSFNYKVINDSIKRVLDNRANLDNRIQVGMPFVKATTTLRLPEFLGTENVGFTLGLHAIPEDTKYEDIYSDRNGNALIGYTYNPNGGTQRVYAQTSNEAVAAGRFFDGKNTLFSNTNSSVVPPPGITNCKIGRIRNGVVSSGDIEFVVPTLSQLEVLHRVFLVPGAGMVLEWGYQYAQDHLETFGDGETGLVGRSVRDNMFPWYDRDKLMVMLERLGRNEVGLDEVITNYVLPTQGQYQWIFGRIANFSTKANGDGSYNCTVKIVGPAENAWAYGVRNTIVAPRNAGKVVCADSANSIETYFNSTSTGLNLKSLLETIAPAQTVNTVSSTGIAAAPQAGGIVFSPAANQNAQNNSPIKGDLAEWAGHVQRFVQGNKKGGEAATTNPNTSKASFGDSEDAYFMTWRFFVNVVLNDERYGLKAIFKKAALLDEELKKINILRSYKNSDGSYLEKYLNDEYENFVGNNPYLRSVDPSTMIIVNDLAANLTQQLYPRESGINIETDDSRRFKNMGDFYLSDSNTEGSVVTGNDRGLLSAGVWINHKAVIQAMASADTIVAGLTNLLNRMNAATNGYWKLTLDSSEPMVDTLSGGEVARFDYTIIDANYRENSQFAVNEFIDKVHVFNKYIRQNDTGLYGSDVIDCTVDLNLPKRLFSQIATLGLVQPSDVGGVDTPILGDPNDTFRKMFSITSISANNTTGESPDLTMPSTAGRAELLRNAICGGSISQTTAGTAGVGVRSAPTNAEDATKSKENLEAEIATYKARLEEEPCKTTCAEEVERASASTVNNLSVITDDTVSYIDTDGILRVVPINKNYKAEGTNAYKLYVANYRNGRINTSQLKLINRGAHRLYKDAAEKFIAMSNAAKAVGINLDVRESYRPLTVQAQLVAEKGLYGSTAPRGSNQTQGLAARPGQSNHGWGLAVDISVPNGYQDAIYKWLQSNASTFGFENIPNEPWHWEYTVTLEDPIEQATPIPTPSNVVPATPINPNIEDLNGVSRARECAGCVRLQLLVNQKSKQLDTNNEFDQGVERLGREFPNLNTIFRYIEPMGDLMSVNIARSSNGDLSNAFGAAPGALSINASLTLPGINGLRVGELFWVDRIPAFYRAFGAFQIISIEDNIGVDGWITRIEAKFNYLGNKWREAMAVKLNQSLITSRTPIYITAENQ